jgi:hypothetical protein
MDAQERPTVATGEALLDETGRLTRLTLVGKMSGATAPTSYRWEVELSDFGRRVQLDLPDESTTADLADVPALEDFFSERARCMCYEPSSSGS